MRNHETLIEVDGVAKRFGDVVAVDSVAFTVHRGELFGFLGPNGAGKTTTINMLTGLARPDTGAINIAGIDCTQNPRGAQHMIGVVPDESNLYPELSGFENLCFCGSLYGFRKRDREARARELLDQFGLADAAGRKFAGYSKGMKRKLTIAAGIIHGPPILFLDEPTTGIDVASARQIRQRIADLNAGGTTVFLTTHYIEEAERLCQRIAFIVKGRIVRIDTVDALMHETDGRHVVQFSVSDPVPTGGKSAAVTVNAADLCAAITGAFPHLQCRAIADTAIRVESPAPVRVGPLVRLLEDRGAEVAEARKIRPSLEEVFVRITGIEPAAMKLEKAKIGGGA